MSSPSSNIPIAFKCNSYLQFLAFYRSNLLLNSVNCVLKIALAKNGIKKNSIAFAAACPTTKISNTKKAITVCNCRIYFHLKHNNSQATHIDLLHRYLPLYLQVAYTSMHVFDSSKSCLVPI